VKRSSGDAGLMRAGGPTAARPGDIVAAGMGVQTVNDGQLLLATATMTIELRGDTVVTGISSSGSGAALEAALASGLVSVDATRGGGRSLTVTTGQARVEVGASICDITATAERTLVDVSRGSVSVARADGQKPVALTAGQHASVATGSDPAIELGSRFVRGINFGGEAVTVDGHRWLGHRQALQAGMELAGGTQLAKARSITAPGLDYDLKSLLDCGLTASGPIRVFQSAPNGDYDVLLWISDDRGIRIEDLTVNIFNRAVAAGSSASGAASWRRLGPYRATVKNHRLEIGLTCPSSTILAGMALSAVGAIEGGLAPYAAMTIPGENATFVSLDHIPLAVDVGSVGDIAKVVYTNGAATIAEAEAPPFTATWHHPPPGKYLITAVVSTRDGATTRTSGVAGQVEDAKKPHSLLYEYWADMGHGSIAKMRADPRFAGPPNGWKVLSDGFRTPSGFRDQFAARIRGYVVPPADGDYVFYMVSDDGGEFWLGTDEKPESRRLVTSVPEFTGYAEWNKYPTQTSAPVTLVKGRRYYVEALYTDGILGDILVVGWKRPDGKVEKPIPAECVEPFAP
jgi:hypothetical protein